METGKIDTDGLELMKQWLSIAVAYIITTRRERNRPPFMATLPNIRNVAARCVNEALDQLVADGTLMCHPTLNDKSYEFANPQNS